MHHIAHGPTLESPGADRGGGDGARTPNSLDAELVAGSLRSKLFGRPEGRPRCGRFEVRRRLGEGGMGVVYEAWDPDLERRVALKLLSDSYGLSSEHRKRLVKEAQTLARLRHPNIVGVYEVGVDDGRIGEGEAALRHLQRAMTDEHAHMLGNRAQLRGGLSRALTVLGRDHARARALAKEAAELCEQAPPRDIAVCAKITESNRRSSAGHASPATPYNRVERADDGGP